VRRRRVLLGVGAASLLLLLVGGTWLLRVTTRIPQPSRRLGAELAAKTALIPIGDRAWPHYRQLSGELRDARDDPAHYTPLDVDQWPTYREWIRSQRSRLDELIEASSLPALGLPWNDREMWPGAGLAPSEPAAVSVGMQAVAAASTWRKCARVLQGDALVAIEEGDAERALKSAEALISMTRQALAEPLPIVFQLTAGAVRSLSLDTLEAILAEERLRGSLEWDRVERILAIAAACRETITDELPVLQEELSEFYSAPGWGGGYLTAGAIESSRRLQVMIEDMGLPTEKRALEGPSLLIQLRSPSLDEALATASAIIDRCEQAPTGTYEARAARLAGLPARLPYEEAVHPLAFLRRAAETVAVSNEVSGMRVDCLRMAAQLLRSRAEHGVWPESDAIAAPNDRLGGGPLRWRIVDSVLIVYSVGADGVDDGGVEAPPQEGDVQGRGFWARHFDLESISKLRGDAVVVRLPAGPVSRAPR
jgi:hypothetical protein